MLQPSVVLKRLVVFGGCCHADALNLAAHERSRKKLPNGKSLFTETDAHRHMQFITEKDCFFRRCCG